VALASVALQKAVYERLANDTELTALIGTGKVFDYVPDGTTAPFVVIGDDGDGETLNFQFTDLEEDVHELTMTFHTFTEAPRGRLAVKQILSRLHDLLIAEVILLEEFVLITVDFVAAQVLRDEDSLTYHGVFRCRCVVRPANIIGMED